MISDAKTGLRVIVSPTKEISFHVHYAFEGSRPFLLLGYAGEGMTVERARKLARTIRALAAKEIDPQSGLRERLIRELEAEGEAWTGR